MKKLLNNWNICTKLGRSICGCWPSKMERSIARFVTMRKMRGPLQKLRLFFKADRALSIWNLFSLLFYVFHEHENNKPSRGHYFSTAPTFYVTCFDRLHIFFYGWFRKDFYALSFYYIRFLLFFYFRKEITESNVYLTFSIIRALLIFFKTNIKRKLNFFTANSCKDKMEWLVVSEIWVSIEAILSPARS